MDKNWIFFKVRWKKILFHRKVKLKKEINLNLFSFIFGHFLLKVSHGNLSIAVFLPNWNQRGDMSTLKGCSLKLEDKFPYLESSVSSSENDIITQLAKA